METTGQQSEPTKGNEFEFGQAVEMENCGFTFHPLLGFELEVEDSVYMYADSGNVEVFMAGGQLTENDSIADLNDELTAEFMENVGDYALIPAGTDKLQNITGFLNDIQFSNHEEEGLGYALICSPYVTQYFFILMIASAEYWEVEGKNLYEALKAKISFHPQFTPEILQDSRDKYPDLTTETHEAVANQEDFIVTIEKRDISLLLAGRSHSAQEQVTITEITAPDGQRLYSYNPALDSFSSSICPHPLIGDHGEVCFFFPRSSQQSLASGEYRFGFNTKTGMPLQEVQIIIRSGRALEQQRIDFNFWLAVNDTQLSNSQSLEAFEAEIRTALQVRLAPLDLLPGKIEYFYPAPDELDSFSTIYLDTDLADCSYMISESINNTRALNIGLVNRIIPGAPPTKVEVNAASSGSPGMILAPGSPHACILVNWSAYQADLEGLSEAVLQQLVIFSGIDTRDIPRQPESSSLVMNKEIAWRLRHHPLFYDGD